MMKLSCRLLLVLAAFYMQRFAEGLFEDNGAEYTCGATFEKNLMQNPCSKGLSCRLNSTQELIGVCAKLGPKETSFLMDNDVIMEDTTCGPMEYVPLDYGNCQPEHACVRSAMGLSMNGECKPRKGWGKTCGTDRQRPWDNFKSCAEGLMCRFFMDTTVPFLGVCVDATPDTGYTLPSHQAEVLEFKYGIFGKAEEGQTARNFYKPNDIGNADAVDYTEDYEDLPAAYTEFAGMSQLTF